MQKRNAANTIGLSSEQKMTAALRMLAYGMSADSLDEYVRIGETTTIECVKRFCQGVVEIFGPEYLRSPNAADISRLLRKANQRGFPGMLGNLDCMHWRGKTVQQHITECILAMFTDRLLCSKPSPPMTCGYGMLFLACPGLTMILMYSTPPICSLTCEKDVAFQ